MVSKIQIPNTLMSQTFFTSALKNSINKEDLFRLKCLQKDIILSCHTDSIEKAARDVRVSLLNYLEADGVDGLGRGQVKVIGVSSVKHRHVAHGGCRDQHRGCVHYPDEKKRPGEQISQKKSVKMERNFTIYIFSKNKCVKITCKSI